MYSTNIKRSYHDMRSLYLSVGVRKDARIEPGEITFLHADDPEFSVTGKMDEYGYVSGMAKLYHYLGLKPGMTLEFKVSPEGSLIVTAPAPQKVAEQEPTAEPGAQHETVFDREGLRHVHLEPFRPESLNRWQPETEPDVYMAFGVLQDYTDYQYCCGASKAVLTKLGADYSQTANPDAILIDRVTGQYVMAEWKKASSEYKVNHGPDDVDVLICWEDNETDRSKLPPRVIALRAIAQKAAERALGEQE